MATIPISDDIDSEDDLIAAVGDVGDGLQKISYYLKANPKTEGRIRFPRGYLSTVDKHNTRYPWIKQDVLKRNLSYQYIF